MYTSKEYFEIEKSSNYSNEDFVTMTDYHSSFYSAPKLSQLRLAIVPGTDKYFNQSFNPSEKEGVDRFPFIPRPNYPYMNTSVINIAPKYTEYSTGFQPYEPLRYENNKDRINKREEVDDYEYASYPKLQKMYN